MFTTLQNKIENGVRASALGLGLGLGLLTATLGPAVARDAPQGFSDLAERLLPAVVNISTTQSIKGNDRGAEIPMFPPGSPFEDFFRDFMERQGGPAPRDAQPRKATSLGSGFIVDPAGLVVTNNHVIADADEITVTLSDNSTYTATLLGRDTKTDLALLKINPEGKTLTAVSFGDSDKSRIGDWVLAIGNPFGLGGSVTAGIVSARARDINSGPYDDYIQTDASINRGNSGGPLLNMNGEVVGINTAIYSPSGGSIGIGFAVPSSLAKPVIDDLKAYGKTRRGWIGVRIQTVDKELAESLGLKEAKGALVAAVDKDGPADKAGLKAGDVILKFAGKDVNEMRRLPRIVAETPIDSKADLEVWRDGKTKSLDIKIGELVDPVETKASAPAKSNDNDKEGSKVIGDTGLSVAAATPAIRERFGLDENSKGLVIVDVSGGPASEKGLRAGDVIIEAGNKPVSTPTDLEKAMEAARISGAKFLLLRIENAQSLRYVPLPVGKK